MRIDSRSNKPLNEITLRLYSVDTKMRHRFIPFGNSYGHPIELDKDANAYIEFQDSREIDLLIDMLERFKRENILYFGEWS